MELRQGKSKWCNLLKHTFVQVVKTQSLDQDSNLVVNVFTTTRNAGSCLSNGIKGLHYNGKFLSLSKTNKGHVDK